MGVHPVILCGGPGSRLWPASTAHYPKPFIDLLGGPSLFQRTVLRMAGLPGARPPVIVTGLDHVREARGQLEALGIEGVVLGEPVGRDSLPALLAAAVWIARTDPTGVIVAVASDHHIPDGEAFGLAVAAAAPAAHDAQIVTFGVRPDCASTAYGYIRLAEALTRYPGVLRVGQFVEKPDLVRAEVLVAEGCLWNSGNFMVRTDVLLEEAARFAPDVADAVTQAVASGVLEPDAFRLGSCFGDSPRISIDVGVMEKTTRAAVLPIDYAWSDLGAWDAVWSSSARDERGNAVTGVAALVDTHHSLVRAAPGSKVVAVGLTNIAIVVQDRNVLVSALPRVADLKTALAALEIQSHRRGRPVSGSDKAAGIAAGPRLKGWLWEKALPLWWCFGADHLGGGFHERLGQDLVPIWSTRRARVQARQVYVYAAAGLMGWPGPWVAAVNHGLDYLIQRYQRPDGLFRNAVSRDGAPVDDSATLYNQAFVLLALATAAQALPNRQAEFSARAEALAGAIRRTFAREGGGFRADDVSVVHESDPIMHLFEAVLAWIEVADTPLWAEWAAEIADLFLGRMVDQSRGLVAEAFDKHWRPLQDPEGVRIEPGHQFEWAWLMERWSKISGDARARSVARALFLSGERGVDPASGLVLDDLLDDFSVLASTSRLWPQTERLRAALLLAPTDPALASTCYAAARSAAHAMEAYFDTPVLGLWRDTPIASGPGHAEPAPASSFYHIIGAILALHRARAENPVVTGREAPGAPGERVLRAIAT